MDIGIVEGLDVGKGEGVGEVDIGPFLAAM